MSFGMIALHLLSNRMLRTAQMSALWSCGRAISLIQWRGGENSFESRGAKESSAGR